MDAVKLIAPSYYSDFSCLMGGCRHSCCIGWEIDIDAESLARYRAISGEMGTRLAENIDTGNECACFHLTEDERCPFLNKDGLCEMILELGEESLCQICADHPRFRNFFTDRTEIGLGMCCEASAALILTRKDPVFLTIIDEDGEENPSDEDEAELLCLRDKLIEGMQQRDMRIAERVSQLCRIAGIDPSSRLIPQWADFFASLERLDEAWSARLDTLSTPESTPLEKKWDIPFEQLMVYLIYRHLPSALEDGDADGKIAFCVLAWRMIREMFARCADQTIDELIELCRLYSSEIEYSDENICAILSEIDALRG